MAYPLEETFASGIPEGFARNGGHGNLTASWSPAQQAFDLVFGQGQNIWEITPASLSADFWFEMDVEVLASTSPPHFGFWLRTGGPNFEGQRLCVHNGQWLHSYWTGDIQESERTVEAQAAWAVVGARHTLRLDAKHDAQLNAWQLQLSVGDEPAWCIYKRWHTTLRPAAFGQSLTLRLHRVAGNAGSGLADAPPVRHHGLSAGLKRLCLSPANAAAQSYRHRGLRPLLGQRNHYYNGDHGIAGSVKRRIQGVVADEPLRRRVLLIDEATFTVVRETWSDAATGAYAFEHIDAQPQYLVIAFDHEGRHRAVIADKLRAQALSSPSP